MSCSREIGGYVGIAYSTHVKNQDNKKRSIDERAAENVVFFEEHDLLMCCRMNLQTNVSMLEKLVRKQVDKPP
tara:strand:- start:43 stop:261 length:219 start_codon:yes stop_codon:yes gene_type:complete